jgi:Ca2+-binding EF-hand superfamily protein
MCFSGFIDFDEFVAMHRHGHMSHAELRALFDRLDVNGDGKLGRSELLEAVEQEEEKHKRLDAEKTRQATEDHIEQVYSV